MRRDSQPTKPRVRGDTLSLSGRPLKEFLDAILANKTAFRFQAQGFSMHPFIRDGDVITVSPRDEHGPKLGEVVAFCYPETDRFIIHRVIEKRQERFVIRGDNTLEPDGMFPPDSILGTVTRVERKGRRVCLGQGPERRMIAVLNRYNLLIPLIQLARRVLRPIRQGTVS